MLRGIFGFVVLALAFWAAGTGERALYYQSDLRLASAPAYFRDADPITSTHECTHGVNSMLRNRHGGNCFYIRDGRFARLASVSSPRLSQVAAAIRNRGEVFQLYLRTAARHWDDTPMYLMDEWSAYLNGAETASANFPGRRYEYELRYALEMAHYSDVMINMLPASYVDRQAARRFWIDQARRTMAVYHGRVHYSPRQDAWAQLVRTTLARYR